MLQHTLKRLQEMKYGKTNTVSDNDGSDLNSPAIAPEPDYNSILSMDGTTILNKNTIRSDNSSVRLNRDTQFSIDEPNPNFNKYIEEPSFNTVVTNISSNVKTQSNIDLAKAKILKLLDKKYVNTTTKVNLQLRLLPEDTFSIADIMFEDVDFKALYKQILLEQVSEQINAIIDNLILSDSVLEEESINQ